MEQDQISALWGRSEVKIYSPAQGRIYIGASGSMAPGPEVPKGPFESKKNILLNLWRTRNRLGI